MDSAFVVILGCARVGGGERGRGPFLRGGVAADRAAIPARQFLSAWAVWWTGDAMGVLVVAPFLLSLLSFRRYVKLSWRERAEGAALLTLLTVVTFVVMRSTLNLKFLVL